MRKLSKTRSRRSNSIVENKKEWNYARYVMWYYMDITGMTNKLCEIAKKKDEGRRRFSLTFFTKPDGSRGK